MYGAIRRGRSRNGDSGRRPGEKPLPKWLMGTGRPPSVNQSKACCALPGTPISTRRRSLGVRPIEPDPLARRVDDPSRPPAPTRVDW